MKRTLITLTALALAGSAPLIHAGSHTWSGAANGYWNNDANWSSGGKPVAGETNVALFFPLAASRVVVTNNIPGLKISTIALNGDYMLHGSGGATLDFTGANAGITVNGARTNLIASSLPIELDDSLLFHFSNAAGHLEVRGVMSGAGGVTTRLGPSHHRWQQPQHHVGRKHHRSWQRGSDQGRLRRAEADGHKHLSRRDTINGGKLLINGAQPASAVTVKVAGTLGGSGVTGFVTAQGGTISPGNSPGQLTSGSASLLTNSILEIELNGLIPGTNCDQLNVAGTVNLGGATLNATLGFASAVSNQFMIVRNDGNDAVVGTFKELPEGATTSMSGAQFRISYAGGTGNDVVLTQLSVAPAPTIGGITKLPNGQIQFTGTGVPGLTYTIEANFDLGTTNWLNLGEITAQPPAGALEFFDIDAAQYPQRFYRFVAP